MGRMADQGAKGGAHADQQELPGEAVGASHSYCSCSKSTSAFQTGRVCRSCLHCFNPKETTRAFQDQQKVGSLARKGRRQVGGPLTALFSKQLYGGVIDTQRTAHI